MGTVVGVASGVGRLGTEEGGGGANVDISGAFVDIGGGVGALVGGEDAGGALPGLSTYYARKSTSKSVQHSGK